MFDSSEIKDINVACCLGMGSHVPENETVCIYLGCFLASWQVDDERGLSDPTDRPVRAEFNALANTAMATAHFCLYVP